MVLSGAHTDVHPGVYGQRPRVALDGEPDLARDRRDVGAMRTALAGDIPIVGICRGHQLLNVLSGGTLFQDLKEDGGLPHAYERHDVRTAGDSSARALFGRDPSVSSFHHQAVSKLGRDLRVTAVSPDGVVETVERTDRRFAIGVQWHPQGDPDSKPSKMLAEALLEQAVARRAA
jgi:gamma-glutamyl-gamma-aminobutyrate hydrolase PuuD